MNRFLVIVFCLTFWGCTSQAKNKNMNSGSNIKELVVRFDSLESRNVALSTKIDGFTNKVDSLKNVTQTLESKIESKYDNFSCIEYILCISIFIGLLVIAIIMVINKKLNKKIKILHRDYEDLKRGIDFYFHSLKDKKSNSINNVNQSLQESRLSEIEDKINFLSKSYSDLYLKKSSINSKSIKDSSSNPKPLKEAYFGMIKGEGFFNDIYTVNKDESLFKITYLNDKEVSFVPLDLQKIRVIDDIEKAVHFIGDISLKNAISFVVKSAGYAVKNGDVWEIKDKVEILLK